MAGGHDIPLGLILERLILMIYCKNTNSEAHAAVVFKSEDVTILGEFLL